MELTFAWHIDADADIERALLYDKAEEAARLSQGVEAGNRILESWVLRSHGRMLGEEGCTGSAQMASEYLEELPDIVRQVEEATSARMHVGVGSEPSEAVVARKVAEERGGDPAIVLYTPDISEEARGIEEMSDDEADSLDGVDDEGATGGMDAGGAAAAAPGGVGGLAKGEDNQREPGEATQVAQGQLSPTAAAPSAPPSPGISASPGQPQRPGQPPPQGAQPAGGEDEDVLGAIGTVLEQFKAQVPFFEQQVKQANPQAYQAVMGMVQGLIALAQQVAGGGPEGTPPAGAGAQPQQPPQQMKKSEGCAHCTSKSGYDRTHRNCTECGKPYFGKGEGSFDSKVAEESSEHPTLPMKDIRQIARDHERLGKDEHPASRHNLALPVGSQWQRRVKVVEPATGKVSWHQASVGQKLSGDNHALSPRVGECPSADSPEKRAADAGLVGQPTATPEAPPQTAPAPGRK